MSLSESDTDKTVEFITWYHYQQLVPNTASQLDDLCCTEHCWDGNEKMALWISMCKWLDTRKSNHYWCTKIWRKTVQNKSPASKHALKKSEGLNTLCGQARLKPSRLHCWKLTVVLVLEFLFSTIFGQVPECQPNLSFGTSGDVCLGFQSQGGSLICMLCRLQKHRLRQINSTEHISAKKVNTDRRYYNSIVISIYILSIMLWTIKVS